MTNDININNNLSDEEKLLTFYTKSAEILEKVVDDGRKTFSIVDELDLPYHVFNWWRLLVEDTDTLYSLISELIEGKSLKGLHIQEFEQFSAKRKLLMFYSEYRTKFGIWEFYGQCLVNWLEERAELNLPVELKNWCQSVISALAEIQGLLEDLFNIPPIDSQPEDKALQDMQAKWWAYERGKFPILGQYETYSNALWETAQHLGLSLFEQTKLKDISPPSGYVVFSTPKHRVKTRIQNNASRQNYGEYIVTLQWRTNDRYQTWQGYSGIAPSLDDVVMVLHHWLVNDWALTRIRQENQWLHKAIIDLGLQPTVLPKKLRKTSGFDAPLHSVHDVYENDIGGKLVLEAIQNTTNIKQETSYTEASSFSVSGIPAYYFQENNEQEENGESIENGTLTWSEAGITYKIYHSGSKLSVNEVIQIAEGLRWIVL